MRNKLCQKQFKEFTNNTDRFTKCFSTNETFEVQFSRWHRQFKKSLHANFRKVRIKDNTDRKPSDIDILMNKRKVILQKRKLNPKDLKDIEVIENEISVECEDREFKKLHNVLGSLSERDGNSNIWRQMRKSFPKKTKPLPTGVKNVDEKVITHPKEKKQVILKHFVHRMRKRPVKNDVKNIIKLNQEIFDQRIKHARSVKSSPFSMIELETTLKNLTIGKSRDPDNIVCEIFKEDVIGYDLKMSVLIIMNKIKREGTVPECMRTANITMLHKKKSKVDLNNWRGIFVTSVLRTILMKMIHERTYKKVSSSMTDSQIGAKKNKSVRNHLFVLNSIISDVLSSKKKQPIDLSILDFRQMFDAEELSICLNSLYEAGIKDDTLALIYEANKRNVICVKTPNGLTKNASICEKIMQGDVMSPLLSSNMVDKNIGKVALATGHIYLYKNKVEIPPLTMQDDTLGISVCGFRSIQMNQFLNTRTNLMNLQFGQDKCEKMHVGKTLNEDICTNMTVDSWKEVLFKNENDETELKDIHTGHEVMKEVTEKKYLGDIISQDGRNDKNIKDRTNKATGNINKIVSTLNERPFGKHKFKSFKLMRDGILLGGLLTNVESWINVTKANVEDLEKPDTHLIRKVLSVTGNPC